MNKQQQHAQQFKDDWTASVHDFLQEGKRGYINDGDAGHYLHKDGGESIQVDADEMYRTPVEGGKTFVEDIPSNQMQDIQQYYHNQQEEQRFGRGGLAQQQVLGSTASSIG